jgi:hypothetical protein
MAKIKGWDADPSSLLIFGVWGIDDLPCTAYTMR